MKMNKDTKILIVGLGLLGGSYAKALSKKGYQVYAITKNKQDITYAVDNHIILDGKVYVKKEFVKQFDLIIFALYPKVFIQWVSKYKDYFKENAILSDVTGVKCEVIYKIQALLPKNVEFIGAHPMAGKEVYGIINSDENMFKNANYIITPTKSNTKHAIEVAHFIGEELEFSNISILTPKKHDEMIAFLSQLTHCIAISLMTCKKSHHLKEYTGDSFRDLTRIANINEKMWSELFLMNKKELIKQMDLFAQEFAKLKDAIENEDILTMKKMMKLSTKRRNYFNEGEKEK